MRTYGHYFAEFLNEVLPVHLSTFTLADLCQITVRNLLVSVVENFPGSVLTEILPPEGENFD